MSEGQPAIELRAGLCDACRHAEILRSKRSAFLRCARADQDARFPRYRALPVLSCEGYEARNTAEPDERARSG